MGKGSHFQYFYYKDPILCPLPHNGKLFGKRAFALNSAILCPQKKERKTNEPASPDFFIIFPIPRNDFFSGSNQIMIK